MEKLDDRACSLKRKSACAIERILQDQSPSVELLTALWIINCEQSMHAALSTAHHMFLLPSSCMVSLSPRKMQYNSNAIFIHPTRILSWRFPPTRWISLREDSSFEWSNEASCLISESGSDQGFSFEGTAWRLIIMIIIERIRSTAGDWLGTKAVLVINDEKWVGEYTQSVAKCPRPEPYRIGSMGVCLRRVQ